MNLNLLNTLVKRNIVTIGTEIEVSYLAQGLDGYCRNLTRGIFSVVEIIIKNNTVSHIKCSRITDGAILYTTAENIIKIDGMLPKDLAAAFDIKEDGSKKTLRLDEFGNPIKRGRKPKHLKEAEQNDRDNRSNQFSNDKTKKPIKRKGRGNCKTEKTTTGRKFSSGTISKYQRNAKISVG